MYSTCQDEPAAGPLPSPEEPPGRETLQAGRTLHPVVSAEEGGFRHVETIFIYYVQQCLSCPGDKMKVKKRFPADYLETR